MFLGTDENQTVFWIEPTIDDMLQNVDRVTTNKFYLISSAGPNPLLVPVTFSEEKQSRSHNVLIASANGKELN